MKKLISTGTLGQWCWRENEIGYKTYTQLTKQERLEHINFLLTLQQEELSTNDRYILSNFGPSIIPIQKHFITLNIEQI